jgi:hypothetical protein
MFSFAASGGNSAEAARQHNETMAQMRAQAASSERQAAQMAEQSRAQQAQMEKQLGIMEKSRQDALAGQKAQLEQLKAGQIKPEPIARVDESDSMAGMEQRKVAAKRQGMRKSILAGESYDAPLLTGPSTLG